MGKPSVAFESEAQARENISRKLKRLTFCLNKSSLPVGTPTSLRKFNAWEFTGSDDESFVSNAHATLTKNSDLKTAAASLTGLANKAGKHALPVRELSISKAREKVSLHLNLRRIAERHALSVMSENVDLRREIDALKSQVDSMVDELAMIRDSYEEELQKVRSRIAQMIRATPSNIKALPRDV